MRAIGAFFSTLWKLYFFLILFFSLLLLYPIYRHLLLNPSRFERGLKMTRRHARFLLFMAGIGYKVSGQEYFDSNKAYIITPNHSSYLDILLLFVTVPTKFVFVGKSELLSYPLFNIFFKQFNIAVNRESIKSGRHAYDRSRDALERGYSVVIFPEGTIPETAPALGPLKNGAFKLALDTNTPIIPVAFLNNYKIMGDMGFLKGNARPGQSIIAVQPPVEPSSHPELLDLRRTIAAIIEQQVRNESA